MEFGMLRVGGERAHVAIAKEDLVVDGRAIPIATLPPGVFEVTPRDWRLVVFGASIFLVGGFLFGILSNFGFPPLLAALVPWAGVGLTVVGTLRAFRREATLRFGDRVIAGSPHRVERLEAAIRRLQCKAAAPPASS